MASHTVCSPHWFSSLQVNANGLLSFGTYYNREWEPHLFPLRSDPSVRSKPVLAPFFADINVRRGGQIKYKNYLRIPDNLPILHRATTDVKRYFPYTRGFDCQMLLVATWTNVLPFCDTRCYSSVSGCLHTIHISLHTLKHNAEKLISLCTYVYMAHAPNSIIRSLYC